MKKIVALASLPSREITLIKVINSLSPQVDLVLVWLNGYTQPPEVSQNNVYFYLSKDNVGDVGKFAVVDKFIDKNKEDFYLFTCDDDIYYPSNYIEKNIELYEEKTIQSSHGRIFPGFPLTRLVSEHSSYHFSSYIPEKKQIHLGGTGVMMMDSSVFKNIKYEDFSYPNMCDIWIACYSKQNNIPIYIIPHEQWWLKPCESSPDSIWESTCGKDVIQTQVLNHYFS